jgi:tRNA nucleotidyltransferase (CCA-adding enzyme)
MLDTISGDRIRHELELILKEELPEKALRRADEFRVLNKLHPSLKGDKWLVETFALARQQCSPSPPPPELYLALLAYRLTGDEIEQLISYLRLTKSSAQALRDTIVIKDKIESLSVSGLAPSRIYSLLHSYVTTALTANLLATDNTTAAEHIELFLNVLRHVKPALTGDDLKTLGIPTGPRIKEILNQLREAKLDGKVGSRREEEAMVKEQIGE